MAADKSQFNTDESGPWFGIFKELGKTKARHSFLQFLNGIQKKAEPVAVIDRGKKVAVINPLAGLITHVGDLEKGKAELNKLFEQSLKRKLG